MSLTPREIRRVICTLKKHRLKPFTVNTDADVEAMKAYHMALGIPEDCKVGDAFYYISHQHELVGDE